MRQFAAWVTDLLRKYQDDLFFRATVNVIALQTGLILVAIAIFAWMLEYTNARVLAAVIAYVPHIYDTLVTTIYGTESQTVYLMFAGLIGVVIFFGIMLARATLRPARESLHYQKLFISNIAHELRTPLSTIKTGTEVALLDDKLPDHVRATFRETIGELDRISDIINNLLSLNRLLRPERMELGDVNLHAIIEQVIRRVGALADERGITIRFEPGSNPMVFGNAAALEQVVENLLKNAIHYTSKDRNGVATVKTTSQDTTVELSIEDTGIGIAQKDLFHVFEPFYRADTSRTRNVKKGGSGLGLAIVSEIVRLHRGKIRILSTVNKGTTVTVTLPRGSQQGPQQQPQEESQGVNELSVDYSKSR